MAEMQRQERAVFDLQLGVAKTRSQMRTRMGYLAMAMLILIATGAFYILFDNGRFPSCVVKMAGGALFTEILGLIVFTWKSIFSTSGQDRPVPLTQVHDSRFSPLVVPTADNERQVPEKVQETTQSIVHTAPHIGADDENS